MSEDKLKIWRMSDDAVLPKRADDGSVGYDLTATKEYIFEEGGFHFVETDIVVEPPKGYYIQVYLRSSLTKRGLEIPNGAGIIDISYASSEDKIAVPIAKTHEGESKMIKSRGYGVITKLSQPTKIEKGERVAQMVVRRAHLPDVEDMTGTENKNKVRGGFGSTGRK